MPRYLSNGLAILLFAGVALVGLAAWNLLTQDDVRSQTEPGDQTAQNTEGSPSNIQIIGDETYIDGEKVLEEPPVLDEPRGYFNQQQNAVGGGPPGDAAPPINQQQQTTPQQQPSTQGGATGGVTTPGTTQPGTTQPGTTQAMTPAQRQAALDQREQALNQRQQQLDQREQELNTLQEELDQREQDLLDWQAELEDWEADLADREAQLEDETAALEEQQDALLIEPSADFLYDPASGPVYRYQYNAPSNTLIREQPILQRPAPREPTAPMAPGEDESPYWHFYGYY